MGTANFTSPQNPPDKTEPLVALPAVSQRLPGASGDPGKAAEGEAARRPTRESVGEAGSPLRAPRS